MDAERAYDAIRWTLGQQAPSIAWGRDILNQAGDWLLANHGWSFLSDRRGELPSVAGEDRIVCPPDWKSVLRLVPRQSNGFAYYCQADVGDVLLSRDGYGTIAQSGIWGAHRAEISPGEFRLVIEFAPEFRTSREVAFHATYDAQWAEITDAQTEICIPSYMNTLYLELVKLWVRGLVREDEASLDQRLGNFIGGTIFKSARTADGLASPVRAPATRTALRRGLHRRYPPKWDGIPDPPSGGVT